MFKAQLLADVVSATVTVDADRLLNRIVGRPHHCGWLDLFGLLVWVVHHQTAEATLWGNDAVGARLIGFIVCTDKGGGRLNIHVIELCTSLGNLLNFLVGKTTLLLLFAIFGVLDVALSVLEHIGIPSHIATLGKNVDGTFSH